MLPANEQSLSMSQARELLPGRPAVSTIRKWILVGVDGRRLAGFVMGKRWFTTREAIQRFVAATTEAAGVGAA